MVDSPYYRTPEEPGEQPPGSNAGVPGPRAAPVEWVVVATATSPKVAAELLGRFDEADIVGRSLPPTGEPAEIAIEVPASDEDRATDFIDARASDLIEYTGYSWHDHPRGDDDARGGLTTITIIFAVLLVVCMALLIAS